MAGISQAYICISGHTTHATVIYHYIDSYVPRLYPYLMHLLIGCQGSFPSVQERKRMTKSFILVHITQVAYSHHLHHTNETITISGAINMY